MAILQGQKADDFTQAHKRQISRLNGAETRSASAALAFGKSRQYQDAADAESTLRAAVGPRGGLPTVHP